MELVGCSWVRCIYPDIVSISLYKVTFIPLHSELFFSVKTKMVGESKCSKILNGVKVRTQSPCVKMIFEPLFHNLSPDESGHHHLGRCSCHRGRRQKSPWWKNLLVQYIQAVWLHFLGTNLSWSQMRPQIIPHLHPDEPISLEEAKPRLIRPHDLCP